MMREDLIERLRAYITQREKIRDGGITITECNGVPLTLTDLREATAALESNAPVGVVGAFEEYHKADRRDPAVALEWEWWQAAWKAAVAQQPAADGHCVTREDGECVSSDPRCMHNKPAAVDEDWSFDDMHIGKSINGNRE